MQYLKPMIQNISTTKQQAWLSAPTELECTPVFKTAVAKCQAKTIVDASLYFGVTMACHLME